MIYSFEKLNIIQQRIEKSLGKFLDFSYDFDNHIYYWKTFCAGYDEIYEGVENEFTQDDKIKYYSVKIGDINYYPNKKDCVDNITDISDSYDYIYNHLKSGTYDNNKFNPIRVTVSKRGKIYTIDKSRLLAFKNALKKGYISDDNIEVRFVKNLAKEIRRIRLFSFEQIRQGFICDNWDEAKELCIYLKDENSFAKKNCA